VTSTRGALDVCFGSRIAGVPTAHLGVARADCGAGRDFGVVTSDQRVLPCSFHGDGFAIESAADVLRIFSRERTRLSTAVDDRGCMRRAPGRVHLEVTS